MTKPVGINIIKSNKLPVEFLNKKTGEMEVSHMVQIGDTVYVSEELFDGIRNDVDR